MDNAQMTALLKSFNAADTPDNTNKIRNAYASDPTAMDRRLYGVKGQSDESGGGRDAILDAMLEKFVQQTAPPTNAPLPVSPMVQNSTAPTRRSATAGASAPSPASQTREQYGPGGSDPLTREVNRNTPSNPNARPPVAAPTSGYEVDPQQSAQSGTGVLDGLDGILPLIVGLFGAGAAARAGKGRSASPEATFAGPMNKEVVPSGDRVVGKTERLPVDPRQIGNSAPSDVLNSPNARAAIEGPPIPLDNRAPSTVTGSPENETLARKAQVQAELDAANKEGNAIQQQMLKGKKAFSPKGAVRNVTGRK